MEIGSSSADIESQAKMFGFIVQSVAKSDQGVVLIASKAVMNGAAPAKIKRKPKPQAEENPWANLDENGNAGTINEDALMKDASEQQTTKFCGDKDIM